MVKVSILIATHNYGKYIRDCLDSVLEQSFLDYEVIIYDDGSTDGTRGTVWSWLNEHLQPFILRGSSENLGQSKAKNIALSYAGGEYVFFLDADNKFAHENALKTFVDTMDAHPEAGFVYCDRMAFGDREGLIMSCPMHKGIFQGNFVDGNMLSRKAAFGKYDEQLVKFTDWDRVLDMVTRGWKGIYVNQPLTLYRFHSSNTGTVHSQRSTEMGEYIKQKYAAFRFKRGIV
jgi:glycosyltransferase involved in cell wall biosynthesis